MSFLIFSKPTFSQTGCAFDLIHSLEERSALLVPYELNSGRKNDSVYVIPVVFHILHEGNTPIGQGENLSNEIIHQALDIINSSFADTLITDFPARVFFCLADLDTTGQSMEGIRRVIFNSSNLSSWDSELIMAASRVDPTRYLNLYTVQDLTDATGFSSMPDQHGNVTDGVVVEAQWLQQPLTVRAVLVHEIGHYVGLLHPFASTCLNFNCMLDGDGVCDTPPSTISTVMLSCTANSCSTELNDTTGLSPFTTDVPDNLRTFMNYSNPFCMDHFTNGQKMRMRWMLAEYRSSLFDQIACSGTVGLPEYNRLTTVTAGPNPTLDHIVISDRNSSLTNYTIQLFNLSGTRVRERINTTLPVKLDLSDLSAGVYKLSIASGLDRPQVLSIVKLPN